MKSQSLSTTRRVSASTELYKKYAYLADTYAKNVFGYEKFGYEQEDIVQELRIRVYNSIFAYAEKWREYQETGRYKPVPLVYYLKTAMVNKVKDMIKKFSTVEKNNVSLDEVTVDHAVFSTAESEVCLDECKLIINGVDCLANLSRRKRICFVLFLKGFSMMKLTYLFRKMNFNVEEMINNQIKYLSERKEQLYDFSVTEYVTKQAVEEY